MVKEFLLQPGQVTLADLHRVFKTHMPVKLPQTAYRDMEKSEKIVAAVVEKGETVYGINTGFGELAKVSISGDKIAELQRNLVLSHATGVGNPLDDNIVRLILLLKINALAQGYSGIRRDVIDALLFLYNNEIYPVIPAKGSVGASGDLAPLAHMTLPLLGVGRVRINGKEQDAAAALKKRGFQFLTLAPKEGLALLNGTQVSTALALAGLFMAEDCFAAAIVAGALSVDAAKGSTVPFYPEIQRVRRQSGQIDVAAMLRGLLKDSAIRESHRHIDTKVQDPYSLRCMPQVMGACLDQMRYAADIFGREANAVTDNPLIFAENGEIYSGGNFHAEPVAMAADAMAVVIAEIGAISERRIAMLIDAKVSGLPAFLVKDAGVNSGFMIAHVTAAALASENKMLSHPASVDSLPTSANQEDHVSMATHGAKRLITMARNTSDIVAIELLAAAQSTEFHAPLKTSKTLQKAHALIREKVDPYEQDHYFAPDIAFAGSLVRGGIFRQFTGKHLLPSGL
ncbi:MAG: histidine ammonia-lyase [Micavibrio sp.]|nr:MAG: histidine ammonia-lyase [Micavibrio sp.]